MGIHITGDRTQAALVMVAKRDGRLVVDLVQQWSNDDGVDLLAVTADVLKWIKHHRVREIAYDRAAAAVVADAVETAGVTTHRIGRSEFVISSQNLFDAVTTGQLLHPNNADLNAQVVLAGRKTGSEGTWFISQAASAGPIPAVLALAFTLNLIYRPTQKGGVRWLG